MTMDVKGRVTRSVGDYHSVILDSGEELLCRTRGRMKLDPNDLLAGDIVQVRRLQDDEGLIIDVEPRVSQLNRPPVANVDQAVIVMALVQPAPVPHLLDRLLILSELNEFASVVLFNKADIAAAAPTDELVKAYRQTGHPVIPVSAKTGQGTDEVMSLLENRMSILAGPSGAGKSSLLNVILPGVQLETKAVSDRISRGRHTTRHVSLLPVPKGGWIADSPGFATVSLGTIDPRVLPQCYPDYRILADSCRFSGCLHEREPGCAVKEAVAEGTLDEGRYQRYVDILIEVKKAFERRY